MRGVLLSAPSSGSGKTVVTLGLLGLLKKRGVSLAAFKCGPDYIDPMFHRRILDVESCNLDSFFLPPKEVRALAERTLKEHAGPDGLGVVEGVMGYFDGLGGVSLQGSSLEMAEILDVPVILVVDGRGASLSLLALIRGFLDYLPPDETPRPSRIAGVILNRVTAGMYGLLKKTIEAQLPVRCLGFVPKLDWLRLESRHLGLVLPGEVEGLKGQMERLAGELEKTLDVDGILGLAAENGGRQREAMGEADEATDGGTDDVDAFAGVIVTGETFAGPTLTGSTFAGPTLTEAPLTEPTSLEPTSLKPAFRLGIAMDEAFCFYYGENLRLLEQAGAQLCPFSPLSDGGLPERVDGLLLGGGYPELHAARLAENASMREAIRRAAERGMPVLAECGGYLYLLDQLEGEDGALYPMAGVFEGTGRRERSLRHFGYITVTAGEGGLYLEPGEQVRGHEFHYWHCSLDEEQSTMRADKPTGNRFWPAMRVKNAVLAGFPHLYYPSEPELVRRFSRACARWRRQNPDRV